MSEQETFLAGALLKWTNENEMNSVKGRVYLLIEGTTEEDCLKQRDHLAEQPELFVELLTTMRPWLREVITVDHALLSANTTVKSVFYNGKKISDEP